jgi:Pro-kumamolisin, activation domain/Bacterial Ig-like domain (group 3)
MRTTTRIRPVLFAALFFVLFSLVSQVMVAAVSTNAHPVARVTGRVDNSQRSVIRGHVPSVITRSTDLGRLPGDTQMRHMMLVLKASFEQENELQKLIDQQHDKRTVNHHQWLTPEEFGEKFGVDDSDIAQVKSWLEAQGLSVEKVGKGKRIIQFSGTSGQVENAFRTEMHYFRTPSGKTHISANSDLYVPTALKPVIAGLHGTNNFFQHPHMVGKTTLKSKIKTTKRKWTFGALTSANTIVGPNDFATIYNTKPLLQAGINGAGVKIGIIGQSDILMSDVQTYRAMFNLPVNNPNFISPGEDAGVSPGDDSESDLDVEIAGGMAPGATVDFVPGASTLTIAGVDLSLMYMVENNTDDIISSSYGGCEAEDTAAYLAFYLAMSEQGAAQGQTLMVASGDSGPSECDSSSNNSESHGYAVGDNDGNAYVLSIGGTQFDEGGYVSPNYSGTSTFWTPGNGNGLASAVSYIPEEPWNEAAASGWPDQGEIWASNGGVGSAFQTPAFQTNGSGAIPGLPTPSQGDPYIGYKIGSFTLSGTNTGYSGTATVTITGGNCTSPTQYYCNFTNAQATAAVSSGKVTLTLTNPGQGYVTAPTVTINGTCTTNCATATANLVSNADPATPIVPGPHRYQPDIAFNAAVGHDPTAYCSEGVCEIDSNGNPLDVGLVGGTSVAAPSYAGVQALVNQYNGGRQGMPGYVLYGLAAQQATTPGWAACASNPNTPATLPASNCVFNDMVMGNTNICSSSGNGTSTCKTTTAVIGWPATTGYDYGTGLGSANVYNLATKWGSVSFNSSATSMSLSANGITHGTSVPVTVNVSGSAGTPTGDVAFTLSSGSVGVPINATSPTFTEQVTLQNPAAFGTLSGGTYAGNINNLPGGTYTVYARYGGDATYGSSSSVLTPVTVNPENSTLTLNTSSVSNGGTITSTNTFTYGQFIWVDAIPKGLSGVGVPTGTVAISDNSTPIATLPLNSTGQAFLAAGNIPTAADFNLVIYQNIGAFSTGSHSLTATYSGDASFNSTTAGPFAFTVSKITDTPTLATGETQITTGAPVTLTASFAAPSGFTAGGNSGNNRSPGLSGATGTVTFTDTVDGVLGTAPVLPTATFSATAVLTTTGIVTSGSHSITASYSGDNNYNSASSTALTTVVVGTATATATAVTSNGNPTTLGGRPTFTATVTGGSPQPTSGTVTFYDGTSVLGTGTVGTAHTATFRVGTSPAFVGGSHNITAAFGGVASTAAASVSPTLVENVTLGTASVQLTGIGGATVGQTVTFSAVVTPSSTSATYAPSSTVQFYDGANPIGSPVSLYFISANNDGYALYQAQYSTSSLSQGTHTITAQYTGDANYPVSTSNAQTLIVAPASTSAILYLPVPSSMLPGTSAAFKWLPGSTATKYWIDVGSSAGGNQYYSSGALTSNVLGAVVSSLPIDGSTVYVTLYSFVGGNWVSTGYTFTASGTSSNRGVITSPAPNSNLTASSVAFSWTAGTGATAYWIDAGSAAGGHDYYTSGNMGNVLTKTVTGLPTNGATVYVTLYSLVSGNWFSNAYTYTALNLVASSGVLTSPNPGSTLTSGTVTFGWTSGSGASGYWLDAGSTAGGHDYYSSGNLGNVNSTTVGGLPTDGSTIYVTLYSLIGSTWSGNAYTYTALNATSGLSTIQTPPPSTIISGSTATFTWNMDASASAYWMDIGTAPGGNTVYSSGNLGNVQTTTVYSLPADGSAIYVTLYSYVGGQWLSTSAMYTSGP